MPAKQHAKAANLAAVSDEATLAELGVMVAGPLIARAVDVLCVIASARLAGAILFSVRPPNSIVRVLSLRLTI